MKKNTSRRRFVQTTAALGVGYWVAGGVSPKVSNAANETVNFASIGVGGKGQSDSKDAGDRGNMVAICDIDDLTLGKASKEWPKAKKFNDFRKMFDEVGKEFDAITVSTPDHTHAVAAAMGMRMGKHCFCQKPMTRTLEEARYLTDLAKEKNLATQMGNQGTAEDSLREAAAILKSGVLGTIKEVHVWTNRPVWPQGKDHKVAYSQAPSHVHWAEFLGPAKKREYSGEIHPFKWRGFWDYGTGALGDMACHTLNMPFMGLNLRDPLSVQATTAGHDKDTYPKWSIITFEFGELGGRAPLKFMWYDGGKIPEASVLSKITRKDDKGQHHTSGCLVVGDKGQLYAPGDYAERGVEMIGVDRPKVDIVKSPGHFQEWVNAIKGGSPAMSNFQTYAGPLTETVLLGNLAVWPATEEGKPGKKVEWDAKNLVAKNAPEVMDLVKGNYLNGYSLRG